MAKFQVGSKAYGLDYRKEPFECEVVAIHKTNACVRNCDVLTVVDLTHLYATKDQALVEGARDLQLDVMDKSQRIQKHFEELARLREQQLASQAIAQPAADAQVN